MVDILLGITCFCLSVVAIRLSREVKFLREKCEYLWSHAWLIRDGRDVKPP